MKIEIETNGSVNDLKIELEQLQNNEGILVKEIGNGSSYEFIYTDIDNHYILIDTKEGTYVFKNINNALRFYEDLNITFKVITDMNEKVSIKIKD